MPDKDWFDAFMDYKLSQSEGDKKPSDSTGCLAWILSVIAVLGMIAKLFC